MVNFNRIMTLLAATAAVTVAAPASAASLQTATTTARAEIVRPLTLVADNSLDFGTIVLNNVTQANSVAMAASGALTCGGQLVCNPTGTAAGFTATGTKAVLIKVTTKPSSLTGPGPALTFTPTLVANQTLVGASSSATGSVSFNVGGTISIDAATVDGVYNGPLEVTAEYL